MLSDNYRVRRGDRSDSDQELDSLRFELAVNLFHSNGNVVPLNSEGKLISHYFFNYQMSQRDLITFFALLGFDPGIVTKRKIIHYKPLSVSNNCRQHLTIERWIESEDEIGVENDFE